MGAGRIFPMTGTGDVTFRLAASFTQAERVRYQIGGLLAGGGADGARFHMFEVGGRIGASLISAGEGLTIEVGPFLEVGWGSLRQRGDDDEGGQRSHGPVVMAALQGCLRAPMSRGVDVLIALQTGYVVAPLTLSAHGMEGAMIGASVGLAGVL